METISIKERIERVVNAALAGISGVGVVYRWDMRGPRDPATGAAVDDDGGWLSLKDKDMAVFAQDETAAEGGEGSVGYTDKTLPIVAALKLLQEAGDAEITAEVINRWLMKIEMALMVNPRMLESTGVGNHQQLAVDSRVTGTFRPAVTAGQREAVCGIELEVTYTHDRANPAIGPGVTAFSE